MGSLQFSNDGIILKKERPHNVGMVELTHQVKFLCQQILILGTVGNVGPESFQNIPFPITLRFENAVVSFIAQLNVVVETVALVGGMQRGKNSRSVYVGFYIHRDENTKRINKD